MKHGLQLWQTCFGPDQNSYYKGMDIWKNRIYLLYNTTTSQSGAQSEDFVVNIVDLRTGMQISEHVLGSTSNDSPLDIIANHFGVFLMGNIGNGFKTIGSADDYQTQNSNDNFALIFMDYDCNILEIESYDTSDASNSINGDYPKQFLIARKNKQEPLYSFLSYRFYDEYKIAGGVYITTLADNQALFVTGNSLATCSSLSNWELCSSSVWFKCEDGYKVQNGLCVLSWGDDFYHQYDDTTDDTNDIDIWIPCHETCKTCSDSTEYGCLTCDSDKVFNSTYNTWECDTSSSNKYLGLYGTCVSDWDYGLAAVRRNEWFKACPLDSDDYSSGAQATAQNKSTGTNWYNLDRHLYFVENTTTPISITDTKMLHLAPMTVTLWVYLNETSYSDIPILLFDNFFTLKLIKNSSDYFMPQVSTQ